MLVTGDLKVGKHFEMRDQRLVPLNFTFQLDLPHLLPCMNDVDPEGIDSISSDVIPIDTRDQDLSFMVVYKQTSNHFNPLERRWYQETTPLSLWVAHFNNSALRFEKLTSNSRDQLPSEP